MDEDKISVELTATEILIVAGDHYQSANAYRQTAQDDPDRADTYEQAAQEHLERADELTALVPEDDNPLTAEEEALVHDAIAREWAREHNLPFNKHFIRILMGREPQGEN